MSVPRCDSDGSLRRRAEMAARAGGIEDAPDLATLCAELRKLLAEADVAPWVAVSPDAIVAPNARDTRDSEKDYGAHLICESLMGGANAKLIMAMRNALPRLASLPKGSA